jgi:hypothetical protein
VESSGPGRWSSGRPQQPNAQQPPQRTPDVKEAQPAAACRGPVGSEADGWTGCWSNRESSGRGAQGFQRAERPGRASCGDPYGWRLLLVRRRAAGSELRFVHRSRVGHDPVDPQVAARRSQSRRRISRRRISRHSQPSSNRRPKRLVKRPARSPQPSPVPRLRVVQPVPARQQRARKPRARYPFGIRQRLHNRSSRSSLDWGLERRPTRLRATWPLHPYSRHRRRRPQSLSRRVPGP